MGPGSRPRPTPHAEDLVLLDKHDVMDLTSAIREATASNKNIEQAQAKRHFEEMDLLRELVRTCTETRSDVAALRDVLIPKHTNGSAAHADIEEEKSP